MNDIWMIGQHGSGLCCPWMAYAPLVNMVMAYGLYEWHMRCNINEHNIMVFQLEETEVNLVFLANASFFLPEVVGSNPTYVKKFN